MADIVSELASKAGVSSDLAKKGVGALLSFIKAKLPDDASSKVLSAFPGADNLMAAADKAGEESSAGILSTVSGLAGKLFGGAGAVTALLSKLTQLGFSEEQLQKFLPAVLEFVKSKLPPDIMDKLTGLIPIGTK
jgi:hypothetical protein